MEEELRNGWSKPLDDLPVYKDLPRLAGRIVIESNVATKSKKQSRLVSPLRLSQNISLDDLDKLEVIRDEQSTSEPPISKTWRQIKKTILGVAANVENDERYLSIATGIEAYGSYSGELELEMRKLFETAIGVDSKTAKVFKVIHQNTLFAGCVELKTKIPMHTLTKDVRGPEGWRILITFTKETCSVCHIKREESLATAPETEKFWFEWKLHMTFDKEMTDLQASFLKVTNLGFGEHISEAKKFEITKILCAGNMMIS